MRSTFKNLAMIAILFILFLLFIYISYIHIYIHIFMFCKIPDFGHFDHTKYLVLTILIKILLIQNTRFWRFCNCRLLIAFYKIPGFGDFVTYKTPGFGDFDNTHQYRKNYKTPGFSDFDHNRF